MEKLFTRKKISPIRFKRSEIAKQIAKLISNHKMINIINLLCGLIVNSSTYICSHLKHSCSSEMNEEKNPMCISYVVFVFTFPFLSICLCSAILSLFFVVFVFAHNLFDSFKWSKWYDFNGEGMWVYCYKSI